jgi:hypothetical protein
VQPNTLHPALIGQRLAAVRVFEPWQASLPPPDALEAALLFGGVAFVFERQALILTSPLRYRSKPVGAYSGEAGQRFHRKLDTHSRRSWTVGA